MPFGDVHPPFRAGSLVTAELFGALDAGADVTAGDERHTGRPGAAEDAEGALQWGHKGSRACDEEI